MDFGKGPLLAGFKQNESFYEINQATSFVEQWLESTKQEFTIDEIKNDLIKAEEEKCPPKDVPKKPKKRINMKKEMNKGWCYICYHCGYFTGNLKILRKHIKRKHVEIQSLLMIDKKPFMDEAFSNSTLVNLFSNSDNFESIWKKKFRHKGSICPHCNYRPMSNTSSYTANANLKRHIREVHSEEKKFSCSQCNYKSKRKQELSNHILMKHSGQEMPFVCKDCNFRTCRSSKLVSHCTHKHSKGGRYLNLKAKQVRAQTVIQCSLCEYQTHDQHNYKSHYKYCHSKEKEFACPHCDHRCTKRGDLKSHIRSIHTKERPFVCPHCDYKASKSGHLRSHVRRKHTRDRPHACPYCSYMGVVPGDVRIHVAAKHKPLTQSSPPLKIKTENEVHD